MRIVTVEKLESILSRTGDNPRVIASGNFAAPKKLLQAVDSVFPTYRLNMLNAQSSVSQAKYNAKNAELQLKQLAGILSE